jgi:hypothetical protein
MFKDGRFYRCGACNAVLPLLDGAPVVLAHSGREPNQRVVLIDGQEIHRCTVSNRNDLVAPSREARR